MKPDMPSAGKTRGSPVAAGRIRAPSLVRIQRQVDIPTRWTLLVLGIWVLWRTRDAAPLGVWPWLIGAYILVAISTTAFWLARARRRTGQSSERHHCVHELSPRRPLRRRAHLAGWWVGQPTIYPPGLAGA